MKAGDCGRKPGVLISSPCLSHHQETNHVPLKTSATPTGWLHLWRHLKDKMKETKMCRKAHLCSIGTVWFVPLCIGYWLGFSLKIEVTLWEWKTISQRCIFAVYILKGNLFWPQTSLASAAATGNQSLQEMKMPAWNCHHIESKPTFDLVIPPLLLYLWPAGCS